MTHSSANIFIFSDDQYNKSNKRVSNDFNFLGKSSLLATWCAKRRAEGRAGDLLVHYVGASSQSADYLQMLKRIVSAFVKVSTYAYLTQHTCTQKKKERADALLVHYVGASSQSADIFPHNNTNYARWRAQ